jgi:putative transposase
VNGQYRYLYRAVDKSGDTIDFLLTARRDRAAALRFLEKAIGDNGLPSLINIDKSGANKVGIEAYNDVHDGLAIEILQCKYLNNVKRRTRSMLGFKSFWTVRVVLGGIELVHMLRKGQLAAAPGETAASAADAFYELAA